MKYNKSAIMKKSHELYNAGGLTQSKALRNAWAVAKIENQLFMLDMVDHQTIEQKAMVRSLIAQRRALDVKVESSVKVITDADVFISLGFTWSEENNCWMPRKAA